MNMNGTKKAIHHENRIDRSGILIFGGPCIVIYSYNKTNEVH